MAETITTKGATGLRWGVDSVAVITSFITQGVTVNREPGIKKEVKDENGIVIARIFGDDQFKYSIKAIYKGGTPPAQASFITITRNEGGTTVADANAIVEKVSWTYANESELLLDRKSVV
jgi:hypothetical protein